MSHDRQLNIRERDELDRALRRMDAVIRRDLATLVAGDRNMVFSVGLLDGGDLSLMVTDEDTDGDALVTTRVGFHATDGLGLLVSGESGEAGNRFRFLPYLECDEGMRIGIASRAVELHHAARSALGHAPELAARAVAAIDEFASRRESLAPPLADAKGGGA